MSITRTYDADKVKRATELYQEDLEGFYPVQWLSDPLNVALENDNGDIALFENQIALPQTVCGHYFFKSRGRSAITAGKEFLEEIFKDKYGINTIMGLTPDEHKAAKWMNRQLGFKEHGTIDTVVGPCVFVVLTKQQWKDSKE